MAAVLLICVVARGWMAWHAEGIARDGHTYVRMARQWWHDPAGVIHAYAYHPGYPALMATVHRLLGWTDTSEDWRIAGLVVAGGASILAMLAVWLWGRMAFGARTACIATLLFGLTRKWCVLGADVLSDSLALCLMVWSLLAGVWAGRALEQRLGRGLLLAALSGLLGGLGYFVRPEAAVVPCLVGVMLVAGLIRRGRLRTACLTIGIGGAAVAAVAIPYMLFIGDVTKKKRLWDMLNPSGLFQTLPAGLSTLGRQFFESMHPVLGGLLCVWLLAWVIRLLVPGQSDRQAVQPNRPMGRWMLAVTLIWGAMLLALFHAAGYVSNRHVMFLALVLSPLAGQGLVILAEMLAGLVGKRRGQGVIAGVLTLLVTAGLAVHALGEPLHQGTRGYEEAAAKLAELAQPGQGILTDQRSMEFALCDVRSDWHVSRVDAAQLEQWRSNVGFPPRQTPKAGHFMMLPDELLTAMEHLHSPWMAIKLPRQATEVGQWLSQLQTQAGIADVGAWPIAGTQDAVYVLGRGSLFCQPAAARVAELALPGQRVLTDDRSIEAALREARSDWQVTRIEADPLEQWRRNVGFAPRETSGPSPFLLPPNELLVMMDHMRAPWIAIKLPQGSPQVEQWLAQLRPSGIVAVGTWPIPGAQDAVHVLGLQAFLCRDAANHLAGLAQPGQRVLTNDRAMESALRLARSDWEVTRIEAAALEQWRLNVGFPPREAPPAGSFLMPSKETLVMMDHMHASWIAIKLPQANPQVREWLADLAGAGIADLGAWPIAGTSDEVRLVGSQAFLCRDAARHLAELAQPGQRVLTNDRATESALRSARSDWDVTRIEVAALEQWRLNVGFPLREAPSAGSFLMPSKETLVMMDHMHASWIAIKLPQANPQVREWLADLAGAGIADLGAWPIADTSDEVRLVGSQAVLCRDAAARLAGLAQPGQRVLTNDRVMESALRLARSDWEVTRIEAAALEQWRLNVGFPLREAPPAGSFLMPSKETLVMMDHMHAAWIAVRLPRQARSVPAWLADLGQAGIEDLGAWPISGTREEVRLVGLPRPHPAAPKAWPRPTSQPSAGQ